MISFCLGSVLTRDVVTDWTRPRRNKNIWNRINENRIYKFNKIKSKSKRQLYYHKTIHCKSLKMTTLVVEIYCFKNCESWLFFSQKFLQSITFIINLISSTVGIWILTISIDRHLNTKLFEVWISNGLVFKCSVYGLCPMY